MKQLLFPIIRMICPLQTQELHRWKALWNGQPDIPTTLAETLQSSQFSTTSYPNISTILHILSITPVTVASTERANSALKHTKRSMMGPDRLKGAGT